MYTGYVSCTVGFAHAGMVGESTANLPRGMGIVGFSVYPRPSCGLCQGSSPPLQPELRALHWVFLPQHPSPRPGHTAGGLMMRGGGHSAA